MTPTRLRTLLAVALVCGLAFWLLLRVVYASLPPLPRTAALTLLLLAIVEAGTGWSLRARLRASREGGNHNAGGRPRRPLRPIPPIAVARLAALAKASSLAGSIFGGLAAGALVYVSGSLGKQAPRQDAFTAGFTLGAALLLIAAALYLEYGCRVPPPPKPPPGAGPPAGPPPGHPG